MARSRHKRKQILSYGGGLDSFCVLLDSVLQRKDPPDEIVFMDVGDACHSLPGEWPETYEHILTVAAPFAREHGIPFYWLTNGRPCRPLRKRLEKAGVIWEVVKIREGKADESGSLIEWLERTAQIPVTGPGRLCTTVAKVERFTDWANRHYPGETIDVWIGFPEGEERRALRGDPFSKPEKPKPGKTNRVNVYPLMASDKHKYGRQRAGRGLDKKKCTRLIERLGYPVPRRSSCIYCPFNHRAVWAEFQRRFPAWFKRVTVLEATRMELPTEAGYVLTIMGWKTYSLSVPQYKLLKKLYKLRRHRSPAEAAKLHGAEHKTFESMVKRAWITWDGRITQYGAPILREAGANWQPPLKKGKTKRSKTDKGVIRRAAQRGRKDGTSGPVWGVHYIGEALEDYASCGVEADADVPMSMLSGKGGGRPKTELVSLGRGTRRRNPEFAEGDRVHWAEKLPGEPRTLASAGVILKTADGPGGAMVLVRWPWGVAGVPAEFVVPAGRSANTGTSIRRLRNRVL